MRGGRTGLAALGLFLSACASSPPPPAAPPARAPEPPPAELPPRPAAPPESLYRFSPSPTEIPPPQARETPKAVDTPKPPEPTFDEILRLQKEAVARRPDSDDDKLRLALLLATAGELEEAERVFSRMKGPGGKLAPYLDLYLRRQLGEHREASKALARLEEEERRATGFVIERAELCTRVKRYRDYATSDHDRVAPGGVVLLYVEPRNFAVEKQADRASFHLRYEWELFDDRSVKVPVPAWEQADAAQKEDRMSTVGPIAEFYQSFRLPLPANLAAGPYRVKVTVTDALAGKSDRVYVPITVGAVER